MPSMSGHPLSGLAATDAELTITREFNAPRELVFGAFTDPAHLSQWWGGGGYKTTVQSLDLRVGGRILLHMLAPDGAVYPAQGVFREIVEPERLVIAGEAPDDHPCGAGLPPRALVTFSFAEHGAGTLLTMHTQFDSAAAREAAANAGFQAGWAASLQGLADLLPTLAL